MIKKYKFSSREKVGLLGLSIFIGVVLIVLKIYMPLLELKEDRYLELFEVQREVSEVRRRAGELHTMKLEMGELTEALLDELVNFEYYIPVEDVDYEFTKFLVEAGVNVTKFEVLDRNSKGSRYLETLLIQIETTGKLEDLIELFNLVNEVYSYQVISWVYSDSSNLGPKSIYTLELKYVNNEIKEELRDWLNTGSDLPQLD